MDIFIIEGVIPGVVGGIFFIILFWFFSKLNKALDKLRAYNPKLELLVRGIALIPIIGFFIWFLFFMGR